MALRHGSVGMELPYCQLFIQAIMIRSGLTVRRRVLMLNRYNGWDVQTGDLDASETAWEEELTGWARENKPIIITEYGADTYPGLHSVTAGSPWTEEYQVECLDTNHRVFDRIDAVVGEQVWNFADFTTTFGIMWVGGNKKGVLTRYRSRRPPLTPCAAGGARTSVDSIGLNSSQLRLGRAAGGMRTTRRRRLRRTPVDPSDLDSTSVRSAPVR